jgi:hypothetical protein
MKCQPVKQSLFDFPCYGNGKRFLQKIKESLPALVRDLFTFSSKVIKSFITVIYNGTLEYTKKKEKTKQKSKNLGADGIRSSDLWIKNPSPYRLRYEGLATSEWQENI